jgi:hypothetical protein
VSSRLSLSVELPGSDPLAQGKKKRAIEPAFFA